MAVNPRSAEVSNQTHRAGGGGVSSYYPLPSHQPVAIVRWAWRRSKYLKEYFLLVFWKFAFEGHQSGQGQVIGQNSFRKISITETGLTTAASPNFVNVPQNE